MTLAAFVSAVLALLLAPGPTNTLMGLAGAARGLRGVARLIPAELAGYLTAILPLAWMGAEVLAHRPGLAVALKAAAAVWVMFLAVRLWGGPGAAMAGEVTARRVYVTTALNPKALVVALILLPPFGEAPFAGRLGLYCLLIAGVALVWGLAGAMTRRGDDTGRRLTLVRRVAAAWLAVVSATLLAGTVGA